MDKQRWNQVVELFSEGLNLPEAERDAWLVSRCPDESLRAEVLAMFAGDQKSLDPGESVRKSVLAMTGAVPAEAGLVGKVVGAWRLVRQIGAGGMGTVYLAERTDGAFRQQAAVKLLNPAIITPQTRQRFENERQILADLKHTNISHLIDGGETDDGLPYLVMEYVEGTSVDKYCDRERLDVRARCELLVTICEAVNFAHNHLVVHRDLKPSNILVTEDGTIKLLDFGIAKLLEGEAGLVTRTRQARPYTPHYASPEQQKGETITTASDVYSLGVLMYKVLSGELPRPDAVTGTMPSRASQTRQTETTADVQEGTDRQEFFLAQRKELKGDLDNIVMMALRSDANRRYSSASGLANDIKRYLRHEPITARADAWSYRASRFIRRYRQPLATAMVMVIGLATTIWIYTDRLAQERDRAEQEAEKARQVASFLEDIFEKADPNNSTSGELTASDLLDQGVESINTQPIMDPLVRGHLLQVMSYSYRQLDEFEKSVATARASIEALRQGDVQAEMELILSLNDLGVALRMQGNFEPAVSATQEALSLARIPRNQDDELEWRLLNSMGLLYKEIGDYDSARTYLEQSLELSKKVHGEVHGETADTMNNLAITLMQMGDYRFARKYLCEAADIGEQTMPRLNNNLAVFINNCGMALRYLGHYKEALERHQDSLQRRQALNGEHAFGTFFCYMAMAHVYIETERFEEASEQLNKASNVMNRHLGPESAIRARFHHAIGRLNLAQGQSVPAHRAFEEAHQINLQHLGQEHLGTQLNAVYLARSLIALAHADQASPLLDQADAYFARTIPAGNMITYPLQLARAELALTRGDDAEARRYYSAALLSCTENVDNESRCVDEPRQALESLRS